MSSMLRDQLTMTPSVSLVLAASDSEEASPDGANATNTTTADIEVIKADPGLAGAYDEL